MSSSLQRHRGIHGEHVETINKITMHDIQHWQAPAGNDSISLIGKHQCGSMVMTTL